MSPEFGSPMPEVGGQREPAERGERAAERVGEDARARDTLTPARYAAFRFEPIA